MWGRGGAGNIAQVEETKRLAAQRAKDVSSLHKKPTIKQAKS
jgi:hypothetical protein